MALKTFVKGENYWRVQNLLLYDGGNNDRSALPGNIHRSCELIMNLSPSWSKTTQALSSKNIEQILAEPFCFVLFVAAENNVQQRKHEDTRAWGCLLDFSTVGRRAARRHRRLRYTAEPLRYGCRTVRLLGCQEYGGKFTAAIRLV